MGLKSDIEKAFIDNMGKDIYNSQDQAGKNKVKKLADGIGNAVINWMKKQELNITHMEAPMMISSGKLKTVVNGGTVAGPGAPIVLAQGKNILPIRGLSQISDTSNKLLGDKKVKSGVNNSKVMLKKSKDD